MYARKSVALGEENSNRDTLGIIIESHSRQLSFGHPNHNNGCRDIRHMHNSSAGIKQLYWV